MTILQATASRTHLLLNCQWAFGQDCPPAKPTEEMNWGNAFHAVMYTAFIKAAAMKYDIPAKELKESRNEAMEVLISFKSGKNPWNIDLSDLRGP